MKITDFWGSRFSFPSHKVTNQASSHFSTIFENEVLVDFIDFGWLDMLDIAYSSSTNCSRSLDNQELPDLRAKLCKMRPILKKKKLKILILDYFFEFECLNKLDNADYDSINGSTPPDNHQLPV